MNDVQESVSTWKLEETNFSAFFLLKILNRHWPDWTFGEDIRSLKQPPTASWISKEKGFSSKIYSVKLFPENGPDFQICVKIPSTFHLESSIIASAENLAEDEVKIQKQNARRIIAQSHAREVAFYKFAAQKIPPKIPAEFFKNSKVCLWPRMDQGSGGNFDDGRLDKPLPNPVFAAPTIQPRPDIGVDRTNLPTPNLVCQPRKPEQGVSRDGKLGQLNVQVRHPELRNLARQGIRFF
uniref:Uncharacterized protein n=1 Tax=Panagrolaimus sp. JU765 TaxID=591449 RepID=A0AC34QJ75_9BILA